MKIQINERLLKGIVSISLAGTMMFSLSSCSNSDSNYKSHFFGIYTELCGDFDMNSLKDLIIYYYYDKGELKFSILKTTFENNLYNIVDFTNNKVLLSLDDDDCVKLKEIEKQNNYDSRESMHFLVSLIYEKNIVDSEPFARYLAEIYGDKSVYSSDEVKSSIDYLNDNKEENFKTLSKKYYSYRNKTKQD